jgi:hypothetical protein
MIGYREHANKACWILSAEIPGLLTKKFKEEPAREKYFSRVYEELEVNKKDNEAIFLIGSVVEYVFRSLPSDFQNPQQWQQLV